MINPGSIWQCVDEASENFKRYCLVKEANEKPDFNGDGDVELIYADGSKHYTKVRRFLLNFVIIADRKAAAEEVEKPRKDPRVSALEWSLRVCKGHLQLAEANLAMLEGEGSGEGRLTKFYRLDIEEVRQRVADLRAVGSTLIKMLEDLKELPKGDNNDGTNL